MAAELYKNGRIFDKLIILKLKGMVKRCGFNSLEHEYRCGCECGRTTTKPQSYFQKKTVKHQCEACAKMSKFKGKPPPEYKTEGMSKKATCEGVVSKNSKNLEYGEDLCFMKICKTL